MAKDSLIGSYDNLPLLLRLLLQLLFGVLVSGIYRIIRFVENKSVKTLVFGILALIPPIDIIFWIVDLVTLIINGKYTIFVD